MATYTMEIPDDKVQTVFDAVCNTYGYHPGDGQTQAEFTRSIVIGLLKNIVIEYQIRQEQEQVRQTVAAELADVIT